ncbi:1,4-dihydroxy-2-naphthoate octaprenyltransferase [Veillonella sp. CHU740]|uniref:1,4-dihydroxy-2-naphthoate octaprenyltransferase n=1 Tax=Veillonella sp. CHU740 TaxID=2490950 RepID=UPI000F8E71AA|nr:1,4-dihydroxy-2-naphthoate octaprenyltransferase [Veillonella sp. CHU740]
MNLSQFFALIRPRTLTAAFSPVVLGAAMGATQFQATQPLWLSLLYTVGILICVLSAQIAANIWNEYFDFKSGLDLTQAAGNSGSIVREGISPTIIKRWGYITTILPLVLGVTLASAVTWWYIPVGMLCILTSILYSGGPKPISRTPFGELASGLAMGFAIVGITLFAWTHTLHWTYLIPAVPSTILIGAIMMTNNLRDFTNDANHGRRTLVILLGRERGLQLLRGLFLISSLWIVAWAISGIMPWTSLLALLSLLPAMKVIHIFNIYADPVHLNEAMKFTSISCTLYHFLWAIGLLLNTIM